MFHVGQPIGKVDNRDGSIPRPTFINQNLEVDCKVELIVLLKKYVDFFEWNHIKTPKLI